MTDIIFLIACLAFGFTVYTWGKRNARYRRNITRRLEDTE